MSPSTSSPTSRSSKTTLLLTYITLTLTFTSYLPIASAKVNDWSKPCISGVCFYDLPSSSSGSRRATSDSSSGTLKIWGSENAITDITAAAGWEIIGCSADKNAQDIRLVCVKEGSVECAHLFKNGGAEGKVVRLPESCGKGPFARVAKSYTSTDQSLPADLEKRIVKRDGKKPEVRGLSLDTNFAASDVKKTGKIGFAIVGANVPGADASSPSEMNVSKAKRSLLENRTHSRVFSREVIEQLQQAAGEKLEDRGFFDSVKDFGSSVVDGAKSAGNAIVDTAKNAGNAIVDTAKNVGNTIADTGKKVVDKADDVVDGAVDAVKGGATKAGAAIGGAVDAVKDTVGDVAESAGDFVDGAIDKVEGLNDVELNEQKTLDPISIQKTFTLVDEKISCPPIEQRLKIDVETKADATVALGIAATGTLVPPKVEEFKLTVDMDAVLDGAINMKAGVGGSIDSDKIQLFEVGIPGLDFPGILTIGPSFEISAQANAKLDLDVDMKIGVNYQLKGVKFEFPKGGAGSGSFTPGDTPLKITATPSAKATGRVEAHLIPALKLGISALGDIVEAGVFLNLDASAFMQLTLDASAGTIDITPREVAIQKMYANGVMVPRGVTAYGSRAYEIERRQDVSFGGCFDVGAGLSVNVGADADFFGLFNAGTSKSLFKKDFELFQKCFGDNAKAKARRSVVNRSFNFNQLQTRAVDLQCIPPTTAASTPVADETVGAASIKELKA